MTGSRTERVERLGPYTLRWSEGIFPLGQDALLLGEFATLRPKWQVCDLGTGSGVLLLLLAQRARNLSLYGVEREAAAAEQAGANLRENGLTGTIWQGSWACVPFAPGQFDLVVSNPPYYQPGSGGDGGPSRMESGEGLDSLCRAAARLVRNGGRFALCHRPERLTDVLCAMREHGLEPKRMQLVAHTPQKPPFLVLVEGVRQGRPGIQMLPVHSIYSSQSPCE